ncbi:MAG: Gluconokinase, partial [uncultured Rubellimicrobium sp.]
GRPGRALRGHGRIGRGQDAGGARARTGAGRAVHRGRRPPSGVEPGQDGRGHAADGRGPLALARPCRGDLGRGRAAGGGGVLGPAAALPGPSEGGNAGARGAAPDGRPRAGRRTAPRPKGPFHAARPAEEPVRHAGASGCRRARLRRPRRAPDRRDRGRPPEGHRGAL